MTNVKVLVVVVAILALGYLVTASLLAKRYFRRRHGIGPVKGDTGTISAGLVGLLWPVSACFPLVRHLPLCLHFRHVEKRERIMERIRAVEQLRQQRGD
jgi:hypothetical protein